MGLIRGADTRCASSAGGLAGASVSFTGSSNQNVLPTSFVERTPIRPPRASMISLQIVRPRPVPPKRRVMLASTCEKGWKSFVRPSGSMPMPVSEISAPKPQTAVFGELADFQCDVPVFRELHGVAEKVQQNLSQPRGVRKHPGGGQRLRGQKAHRIAIFGGAVADHVGNVARQGEDIHRMQIDLHLAILDFCEIENFIDDLEQRLAGAADRLHVRPNVVRQCREFEQFCRPRIAFSAACGLHGRSWPETATWRCCLPARPYRRIQRIRHRLEAEPSRAHGFQLSPEGEDQEQHAYDKQQDDAARLDLDIHKAVARIRTGSRNRGIGKGQQIFGLQHHPLCRLCDAVQLGILNRLAG